MAFTSALLSVSACMRAFARIRSKTKEAEIVCTALIYLSKRRQKSHGKKCFYLRALLALYTKFFLSLSLSVY